MASRAVVHQRGKMDMFDVDSDPFRSMYSQSFVDPKQQVRNPGARRSFGTPEKRIAAKHPGKPLNIIKQFSMNASPEKGADMQKTSLNASSARRLSENQRKYGQY